MMPSQFTMTRVLLLLCSMRQVATTLTGEALDGQQQSIRNPSLRENCTTSSMEAGTAFVTGDVAIGDFSATTTNEFPKMAALNASAWELWYFDGVSTNGDGAAITVSFFRDRGSHAGVGQAGFRAQVHGRWPDGSTVGIDDLLPESVIEQCGENAPLTGVWRDGFEREARFEIAGGTAGAELRFALADVHGTVSMSSSSKVPNVAANSAAAALLAPAVYWLQPMPVATVEVALTIQGKDLRFSGRGGHDRFWTPHSWMTLMDESYYLRASAGPYTMLMLRIVSRINRGRSHVRALLFENDELVLASQNEDLSLTDDYFSFKLTYSGTVRGEFRDTNTGYVLDFVRPGLSKHWRFEVKHDGTWWNLPTGPSTGNTGFVEAVIGGEVGGRQYKGSGGGGQCQLPPQP